VSAASINNSGSPLLRNAIALHAAFGLTGLLIAAGFSSFGQGYAVWLFSVLMAFILVGSRLMQKRLATSIEIDRRLNQLANCNEIRTESLTPVVAKDHAAQGWNRLVETAIVQRLLDQADSCLHDTKDAGDDSLINRIINILNDGLVVADCRGTVLWQNDSLDALLQVDRMDDGQPGLLRFHELFRTFENFDEQIGVLTDAQTLAPVTFEMFRGQETNEGVLRVSRQCLSENDRSHGGMTFLWTIRDVTQQKLALEMRDCFVSAATHELRTPLCNIRAYAETLIAAKEINAEEERQFLNVILSEAGRLERTIDNLLNISHMQAGGMTLDRHETQIERLVNEVQETIRPLFEKKTLNFETRVPPRLPDLNVDKNKLAAALVNLLGNAIKYTPDGGCVRLEAEFEGNEIRFHVEDTGIGIAEVEIPRLFERFFRSSDPRVNDIQGTGLGLAFSHDVARLHGGRIEVASELNKGSRFSLILPASLARLTPS
jgi:signal transduction histidine kinase